MFQWLKKSPAMQEINVERYLHSEAPVKIHIGCGTNYKDSWINIDNNSDNNIEKLDINCDLSSGIPFPNATVDLIYSEHFIEHLSREDGLAFFVEANRVLKKGGVMRIACPDLDQLIQEYVNDTWRDQDWVTTYNCQWIESKVQMLNMCMNVEPWGHKYLYNKQELKLQLQKAGFSESNIKIADFGLSDTPLLRDLDTRLDSMIFDVSK